MTGADREMEKRKPYLEKLLPGYLEKDLKAYKKGLAENSSLLDCLVNELQGSINSAFVDGEITEEQCDYLYAAYVYGEEDIE